LIELLVVMAIIAILAALVLAAGNGVMQKGMRSRASAEIQAMGTANEGYKTDNGIYPQSDGGLTTNSPYTIDTGTTTGGEYQINSGLLYQALSGQTNFTLTPTAGIKVYMSFKANQVTTPASGNTYIKDPWNASYGYSTGSTNGAATSYPPYNGSGFFDLWSTAGVTQAKLSASPSLTNAWISNWTQ
jgi:type II secretory pathway pseudopilin PulG